MTKEMREGGPGRVGQVKEVTSLANPIVKDIKALNPFRPEDHVLGLSAPFFVFLFLALILGLVIGASVTWATQGQHRRRARTEAKTAVRLQAEADKHKARAEELAAQQTVAYGRLPAK